MAKLCAQRYVNAMLFVARKIRIGGLFGALVEAVANSFTHVCGIKTHLLVQGNAPNRVSQFGNFFSHLAGRLNMPTFREYIP